jgi:glycosyltransferase involved in cell wall biosynthesis
MPESRPQIVLVTPVWNDSARLAVYGPSLARALADSPLAVRWIIADDGSEPHEYELLNQLRDNLAAIFPNVETHFAVRHHGKGSVVREAWALAPDADWLAFVDADGSVSGDDMLGLIGRAVTSGVSVLGIRKRTATTRVVESIHRALVHRGFLLTVRLLLGLHCEDPQCGAKVIKGGDYRRIASLLVEHGLAFDSELLAALAHSGADWIEVPVNWVEKKGGKIKVLRDAWRMFTALLRIRAARASW